MRFKHIAIVGVGLIGGSFALAARRAGVTERITGLDEKAVLDEALARGVIDDAERSFESTGNTGGVCDADLIYLAAPVGAILSFLRTRGNSIKPGAILTDSGSTKKEICRVARESLPKSVSFVGGHPMAGSHQAGIGHADATLFQGAPYALIVDEPATASNSAFLVVEEIVRNIGARPVSLTAKEHDAIVARVSHAPQLLATGLAGAVLRHGRRGDLELAGSGFSEMVRLATSHWSMWEGICRTNADEITLALDEIISEMEAIRSSIASGGFDSVGAAFEESNRLMTQLRTLGDHEETLVD